MDILKALELREGYNPKNSIVATSCRSEMLYCLNSICADVLGGPKYSDVELRVAYAEDKEVEILARPFASSLKSIDNEVDLSLLLKETREFCDSRYRLLQSSEFNNIDKYNENVSESSRLKHTVFLFYKIDSVLCSMKDTSQVIRDLTFIMKLGKAVGVHVCLMVHRYDALTMDICNMSVIKWCVNVDHEIAKKVIGNETFGDGHSHSYTFICVDKPSGGRHIILQFGGK